MVGISVENFVPGSVMDWMISTVSPFFALSENHKVPKTATAFSAIT